MREGRENRTGAHRSGRLPFATLTVAILALSGCSGPQSMIDPAGPAAAAVASLWWWMFGFSLIVLTLIIALWFYAMRSTPRRHTREQERRIAGRWIVGGGIVLPMASIIVLLVFGLPVGQRLLPGAAGPQPLRIEAIARQWWWEIRYPDLDEALVNEFRLPVGRPVEVHVASRDVIHSFWIPSLGGKIDAMPGRTNVVRLEATRPGRLRGACAEFCGLAHSRMILDVHAMPAEAFDQWFAQRRRAANP